MSCGRFKRAAILAVFLLVISMTRAEIGETTSNEPQDNQNGRLYFNNQNSTLIPLGSGGAMLVSTVGIVALVIGAIVLISLIFNHHGFKTGGNLFSPWLTQSGYPAGSYQQSQYYTQPQAHQYVYEPYSKLGYQSQPVARSSDAPMDWDSLKILDYISMMEEMWRKLDVHDTGCQKRILCEIHQNEKALGPAASKIVNAFGYARYLSVLNIPDALKNMIDDYQDAADKGRSLQDKECKDVFDSCDFSVKETFLKKLKSHSE